MKKRNLYWRMCCYDARGMFYVLPQKLWLHKEDIVHDENTSVYFGIECTSIRAFRRLLRHLAKRQPELIGTEFTLTDYISVFKNGKWTNSDVTKKLKKKNRGINEKSI